MRYDGDFDASNKAVIVFLTSKVLNFGFFWKQSSCFDTNILDSEQAES